MSMSSYLGYIAQLDPTSHLGADAPFDVAHSHKLLNNISHLKDVSAQYRINWCAAAGSGGYYHKGLYGGTPIWVHRFPVARTYTGKPLDLDVRVGAKTASGTVGVLMRICQDWAPFPCVGNDDLPGVLAYATASTASTSAAWVIDDVFQIGESAGYVPSVHRGWDLPVDDGSRGVSRQIALRIEIELTEVGIGEADQYGLTAVQVREVTYT